LSNVSELRRQAMFNHSRGKLDQAAAAYATILASDPADVEVIYLSGMLEGQRSNFERAVEFLTQAVDLKSDHIDGRIHLALALRECGRTEEALSQFDAALELQGTNTDVLIAKADTLRMLGRHDEAIITLDSIIANQPKHAAAWLQRGILLQSSGRLDEALESLQKARAANPTIAEHHLREGHVLLALHRNQDARAAYDKAVQIDQSLVAGHLGRATAMLRLHNVVAATLSADKARQLQPNSAHAHFIIGCGQSELGHLDEALVLFDEALRLDAKHTEAQFARGEILQKLNRHAEAAEAFAKVMEAQATLPMALGNLLYSRMHDCNWQEFASLTTTIIDQINNGVAAINPVGLQSFCKDEATLRRCAEITASAFFPKAEKPLARPRAKKDDGKICLGYVGGDFRDSIAGGLLRAVLEHHDRNRFELVAVDTGLADKSVVREKLEAAVDKFVIVTDMSDNEAANRIAALQLDVLVNLGGFFSHARPGIFALRPCGVQINYGFPGTLGADYIDYLIADPSIVPESSQSHYNEKIAYLDDGAYLAYPVYDTDSVELSRGALNLPDEAFVFACFESGVKITPEIFAAWMQILSRVPDSVLWLLEHSAAMKTNLLEAASAAGVSADRLVFSPITSSQEHFARQRLADLFLDTSPWGSPEPLFAGVPLLSIAGHTMPGRISTALLGRLGMDELMATDLDTLVTLACKFAKDRDQRDLVVNKLRSAIKTSPAFDPQKIARALEGAVEVMTGRATNGLPPETFHI
jgi:predicted O-linked N-acetylglucosamine transferase (SPINDLY family)